MVDLAGTSATLSVSAMKLEDYHDIGNALADGPSIPASASFTVTWAGDFGAYTANGSHFAFSGKSTSASIDWSASESGFSYQSAAAGQVSEFAILGTESNHA